MREPLGGLNAYRSRYRVQHPLRYQSTVGALHDEVAQYDALRRRPSAPLGERSLRILIVGELAHNPERILALEARGHELYGLWTDTPTWFNTVGPVPFGHVVDLPRENWHASIWRLRPEVIYSLMK